MPIKLVPKLSDNLESLEKFIIGDYSDLDICGLIEHLRDIKPTILDSPTTVVLHLLEKRDLPTYIIALSKLIEHHTKHLTVSIFTETNDLLESDILFLKDFCAVDIQDSTDKTLLLNHFLYADIVIGSKSSLYSLAIAMRTFPGTMVVPRLMVNSWIVKYPSLKIKNLHYVDWNDETQCLKIFREEKLEKNLRIAMFTSKVYPTEKDFRFHAKGHDIDDLDPMTSFEFLFDKKRLKGNIGLVVNEREYNAFGFPIPAVFWAVEPPMIDPHSHKVLAGQRFKYGLTPQRKLANGTTIKHRFHGNSWINPFDAQQAFWNHLNGSSDKVELISHIFSPKRKTIGQRMRHQRAEQIRKIKGSKLWDGSNFLKEKRDALLPFMFHVCIENCDIYFTEKLIDSILTMSMPIYYGDKDIGKVFDTRGMILLNEGTDKDWETALALVRRETYFNPEVQKAMRKNWTIAWRFVPHTRNIPTHLNSFLKMIGDNGTPPQNLLSPKRFDVLCKIPFCEMIIGAQGCPSLDNPQLRQYSESILLLNGGKEYDGRKTSVNDFIESYAKLVMSVLSRGFDEREPIYVGRDSNLFSGAHRTTIGCCLGISSVPSLIVPKGQIYDVKRMTLPNRFSKTPMSQEGRDAAWLSLFTYCQSTHNYRIVVDFSGKSKNDGSNLRFPDEIKLWDSKILTANRSQIISFMKHVLYFGEPWTKGNGAISKVNLCFGNYASSFGLIVHVVEAKSFDAMKKWKDGWRKTHGRHTVHTTDNSQDSLRVAQACFHHPTWNILKLLPIDLSPKILNFTSVLRKHLTSQQLRHLCVVGSGILGVLKIREPADVDALWTLSGLPLPKIVSSHSDYINLYGHSLANLVHHPDNYVIICGVKFSSPSIILQFKKNRDEVPKDRKDVAGLTRLLSV